MTPIDAFFRAREAAEELAQAPSSVGLSAVLEGASEVSQESGSDRSFGPLPSRHVLLVLDRGCREARGPKGRAAIAQIAISRRTLSWGPDFARGAASLSISLATGERFAAAEALAATEDDAGDELEPLRAALEAFVAEGGAARAEEPEAHAAPQGPRFALGFEGDAVVLRDQESRGPREHVGRYRAISFVSLLLALSALVACVQQVRSGAPLTSVMGFGAAVLVALLAAFAMFEVARYAAKYRAESAPLAWFADDCVVVMPWVSRDGAVDRAPEGRLGAAIPPREIQRIEVRPREGLFAVTLDGPHGPMEVMLTGDESAAGRYRATIERLVRAVASPRRR